MPTLPPTLPSPGPPPSAGSPVLGLAVDDGAIVDRATGVTLARGTSQGDALRLRLGELRRRHGTGAPNLPVRTAGGLQVWGDRRWDGGWRIQENVLTGHCR